MTIVALGTEFSPESISAESKTYCEGSSLSLQKIWNSKTPSLESNGDFAIEYLPGKRRKIQERARLQLSEIRKSVNARHFKIIRRIIVNPGAQERQSIPRLHFHEMRHVRRLLILFRDNILYCLIFRKRQIHCGTQRLAGFRKQHILNIHFR